jgi:hypothetical protein
MAAEIGGRPGTGLPELGAQQQLGDVLAPLRLGSPGTPGTPAGPDGETPGRGELSTPGARRRVGTPDLVGVDLRRAFDESPAGAARPVGAACRRHDTVRIYPNL